MLSADRGRVAMTARLCFVWTLLVVSVTAEDHQQEGSDPPGHLQPLGTHRPAEGHVDTVDGFIDPEIFYRDYVTASKPIVFKGAAKGIPAYELWTDTYLKEKFGDMEVRVEMRKKETRPQEEKSMTFSEYLETYTKTEKGYMVQDVKPNMQADMSLLRPVMCGGWSDQIEDANVWMSSGGTQSVLHTDDMENINCILDGSKQLVMMNMSERQLVEADGWESEGTFSRVDVTAVDMHQFPSLGRVPWWAANMEKGDCLYIPPNWYHAVKSSGPRNLAANIWFIPLLFFNTSDCSRWKNSLPDYVNLSNYRLLMAYRQDYIVSLSRLQLFEKCKNFETITFDYLAEVHRNNEEVNIAEIMKAIDVNGDQRLTWPEIFTADLAPLLLRYGPDPDKPSRGSQSMQELRNIIETTIAYKKTVKEHSARRGPTDAPFRRPMPQDGRENSMSDEDTRKIMELLNDETKTEEEIRKVVGGIFNTAKDEL